MKLCHVCNAQCDDNMELCHICGAELREQEPQVERQKSVTLDNPVLAVSVEDIVTAEIYRDMLSSNEIPFMCDSKENGNLKIMFGGGFVAEDIYVNESDLERAKEIYNEVLASEVSFEEFEEPYEE